MFIANSFFLLFLFIIAFFLHISNAFVNSICIPASLLTKRTLGLTTRIFSSTMAETFKEHGVVPDVIDKAPPAIAKVTYPGNLTIKTGQVLTPTEVKSQPTVIWDADSASFYTLAMTGNIKIFFLSRERFYFNGFIPVYRSRCAKPCGSDFWRMAPLARRKHSWIRCLERRGSHRIRRIGTS